MLSHWLRVERTSMLTFAVLLSSKHVKCVLFLLYKKEKRGMQFKPQRSTSNCFIVEFAELSAYPAPFG